MSAGERNRNPRHETESAEDGGVAGAPRVFGNGQRHKAASHAARNGASNEAAEAEGAAASTDPLDVVFRTMTERYAHDWVTFAAKVAGFDVPESFEIAPTELTATSVRADTVYLLNNPSRVVHIEFQTVAKADFGLRMLQYFARLKHKYDVPVTQIVVAFTKERSRIPSSVAIDSWLGSWLVVQPWDYDPDWLLENLPALAALARQDGSPTNFLGQTFVALRENGTSSEEIEFWVVLAQHRFGRSIVELALRSLDMELTFTDVFADTPPGEALIEHGRQQGREEGREEGREQERSDVLFRQLNRRFGDLSPADHGACEALSPSAKGRLLEHIFDLKDLSDLRRWISSNS